MQIDFEITSKFKKMFRRLPPRMKEEMAKVFDEFSVGELSPGRNLEALERFPGCYSVRLNRQFRFLFEKTGDGAGRAIAVGPHDKVYGP